MVSFRDRCEPLSRPRLRNLQYTQEEIFRQLEILIPDEIAQHDAFTSQVDGSPCLHLEVLERCPYTRFLRLTYAFGDAESPQLAPNAHIRMYQDARLAEVTAYEDTQGFRRSAHPWYPSLPLVQRLWRENSALDKWLAYLLQQGHSFETMRPAATGIPVRARVEVDHKLACDAA